MSGCLIPLSNVENKGTGEIFLDNYFYCVQISFSSKVTVFAVKKIIYILWKYSQL